MAFERFKALPKTQRRTVLASAATLFLTMAAHQLMETSRDALFLSNIPARELPWVYLVIAVISLGVTRAVAVARHLVRPTRLIVVWIVATSAITALFSAATPAEGAEWLLYALYVWTGIVATVTLLQFWTMLSGIATIQEAKNTFAIVGSGAVLGAIAGSVLATSLAEAGLPDTLLTAASILLAVSAVGPAVLARLHGPALDATQRAEGSRATVQELVDDLFGRRYARALLGTVFLAMATVTLVDFVFKSAVSSTVEPAELTHFFAWFYLGINVAALIVQTVGVQTLLRRLTVTGALAIMPLLVLGGAVGFVIGGGFFAAVAMRAIDGSLRHSLYRTATEVLYVPMRASVRRRVKAFIDVAAHRGAQAFASLGILLAVQLGLSLQGFGWGVLACGALWLGSVALIRVRYLDIFRDRLRMAVAAPDLEFPELDVSTLESLVEALSDPDDRRVLAALELLDEEGRGHLIPTLLIYHPSDEVVLHALDLFARHGRDDFLVHAERRARTASASLRGALASAKARVRNDCDVLRGALEGPDATTAAVAAIFLVECEELSPEEARPVVDRALDGEADAGVAIARAILDSGTGRFGETVVRLLRAEDLATRRLAMRSVASHPTSAVAIALRDLLADRALRPMVRESLVALGDKGSAVLRKSLSDPELVSELRWQIPDALAEFGPQAAEVLWGAYRDETDGVVRYRIVRALDRLNVQYGLRSAHLDVSTALNETLRRAWELRHWEAITRRAEEALERSSLRLLIRMLEDKRSHAFDLALRLAAVGAGRSRAADFESVRTALHSNDASLAASSVELLDHLADPRIREPLVALLDETASVPATYGFLTYSFEELLDRMIWGESRLLAMLAVRVACDCGFDALADSIRARREDANEELRCVIDHALQVFEGDAESRESA